MGVMRTNYNSVFYSIFTNLCLMIASHGEHLVRRNISFIVTAQSWRCGAGVSHSVFRNYKKGARRRDLEDALTLAIAV